MEGTYKSRLLEVLRLNGVQQNKHGVVEVAVVDQGTGRVRGKVRRRLRKSCSDDSLELKAMRQMNRDRCRGDEGVSEAAIELVEHIFLPVVQEEDLTIQLMHELLLITAGRQRNVLSSYQS